jgi:membrane-bound ClpP family serine protease
VPDPLAFKALSYGAVGLLALTLLILSVVWLRIEIISGKPLSGFLPVLLIIAALCALISLLTAYVQFQQATSTMLHWERAAFTSIVRYDCPFGSSCPYLGIL